jgi:probable F420-dependent oxidoreductase
LRFVMRLPYRRVDRQADFGSGAGLARIAATADRIGIYAMTISDHPLVPLDWEAGGGHHDLDPFTTLAYLAAGTDRLRLMVSVIVLPYRSPIVVAKMLSTIDRLSSGRVIAGVAAGYLEGEFEALGVPFADRNDMTDEAIRVMKELWTSDQPTFEGKYTRFSGVRQLPRPVQQPHPPIWIGGNSRRAIRRAVELADGWIPVAAPASRAGALHTPPMAGIEDLAQRLAYAREVADRVGRTEPLTVVAPVFQIGSGSSGGAPGSAPDPNLDRTGRLRDLGAGKDEVLDYVGKLRDLGVSAVGITFGGATVDEFVDQMEWFGAEIIPAAAG